MKFLFPVLLFCLIAFTASSSVEAAAADTKTLYEVIISSRPIERDHVITLEDVKSRSVSRLDPRAVTDINAVLGKSLKRTIGKNTTIKRDYLKKGPSVKRGDEITIVARSNGLRVTARGRARENADIGEMIELDNLASGKIIMGRLIDSATVLVSF